MNCRLSQADCKEIYLALGLVRARLLQLRLGDDGKLLASRGMELNRSDAETIYRALLEKRERIRRGAYDTYQGEAEKPGSISFEMACQVEHILSAIGYLGENLSAKAENLRAAPQIGVKVEDLRASLFGR